MFQPRQIDRLIALKQQQIELLERKRQGVISEAVTRGLDPASPTKAIYPLIYPFHRKKRNG